MCIYVKIMTLFIGQNKINKIFVGGKEVNKIFSGNIQIYPENSIRKPYIIPTAQTYVDTGVKLGGSDIVKIKFKYPSTPEFAWNPIYGVGANSGGELTYKVSVNCTDALLESNIIYGYEGNYTYINHNTFDVSVINKLIYHEFNPVEGKVTYKVEDEVFEIPITINSSNSSNFNVFIFGCNDYGKIQPCTPYQLYEFEIVGKCHLVPMLKDGTTPALYDTIRGVWHTNNAFVYGIDIINNN